MSLYYDGSKILNTKDLDNEKPEIFMVSGNRSSGKTTFFNKKMVDDFLQYGKQFVLLYRFNYELQNCHEQFFDDIRGLFFSDYNMQSVSCNRGMYRELLLNDKTCGYAIPLNAADNIKRNSHLFCGVQAILMDEFQSEINKYCDDEITKFISIHTSIARGQGKQNRYVPVYMVSNCVSMLNPYYDAFGICDRLKPNTKILRGKGWVLEQSFNENAANALKESRFLTAFAEQKEIMYMSENVYLKDNSQFVEKPPKQTRYVASVKHNDNYFNISYANKESWFYCSNGYDQTFPILLAADLKSHNVNTTYARNSVLINSLRTAFHSGNFRFKNLKSKQAVLSLLHY